MQFNLGCFRYFLAFGTMISLFLTNHHNISLLCDIQTNTIAFVVLKVS